MEKLIIDTDPAIGIPFRDVDDGLAIALALRSPEFDVAGLTLTYGNARLPAVRRSTALILAAAGRADLPVYPGAASRRDIGRETAASRFIAESLGAAPGEVSILAIGPLTNLAAAENAAPGTLARARRVVVMGGAIYGSMFGVPLLRAEFNFANDPAAADIVARSTPGLVVVPADLTARISFTRRHLLRLRDSGAPLATALYRHCVVWHAFMSASLMRDGFPPHDPLAAAWMLRPDLFVVREERIRVVTKGFSAGRVERGGGGTAVRVVIDVREAEFLDFLVSRLCG